MSSTRKNPIQFVSLISRTDKPLYIQSFISEIGSNPKEANTDGTTESVQSTSTINKFLKFNFFSHMALDIFSSPTSLSLREQQQQQQNTNGVLLLFIQDQVIVYGYESNNGLKIIVGMDQSAIINQDNLYQFITSVYKLYLRVVCNPFKNFGIGQQDEQEDGNEEDVLNSPKFDEGVKKLVDNFI
ncbi:hypothetical protein CORT_0B01270 [Candida orthopsilosis Co 90-125]|uniref:Trafficking protein particle complex subunit n=1 Tax=Candida orthopsilosis (strain 90-125) TaxID=1136231 RepID=H8WZH8_CANO9|nr:hypothetical protein CORT_0B01270 [Candida orthopsilosis Co 90-125]CCG21846.1 hypothetical protein CORT_0B01270 [Candida orthopsilosis Co 90-125]